MKKMRLKLQVLAAVLPLALCLVSLPGCNEPEEGGGSGAAEAEDVEVCCEDFLFKQGGAWGAEIGFEGFRNVSGDHRNSGAAVQSGQKRFVARRIAAVANGKKADVGDVCEVIVFGENRRFGRSQNREQDAADAA